MHATPTTIGQLPPGENGALTGGLGYGAMALEGSYGTSDNEAAVATLARAIGLGVMIDSAAAYDAGHHETLVAKPIKATTTEPFIATKFGNLFSRSIGGDVIDERAGDL
jgi:aryl-alcohol dehydrogenase-like predicted oxidoreductase